MTDKEKLEKIKALSDKMYSSMAYLTTDTRPIRQAMDEYHQFIIHEYHKEEPVSEDNNLRKASEEYLKVLSETPYNNTPITNAQTIVRELITFMDNPSKYNPNHIEESISDDLEEAAQKYAKSEYDRKNPATLPDRCIGCYAPIMYAFRNGAKWQKEQMMSKAINALVHTFDNGYIRVGTQLLESNEYGLKVGDNVKVIIIKEE